MNVGKGGVDVKAPGADVEVDVRPRAAAHGDTLGTRNVTDLDAVAITLCHRSEASFDLK